MSCLPFWVILVLFRYGEHSEKRKKLRKPVKITDYRNFFGVWGQKRYRLVALAVQQLSQILQHKEAEVEEHPRQFSLFRLIREVYPVHKSSIRQPFCLDMNLLSQSPISFHQYRATSPQHLRTFLRHPPDFLLYRGMIYFLI